MNREETLNYLSELRYIVAPVGQASYAYQKATDAYNRVKDRWNKVVGGLVLVGGICILGALFEIRHFIFYITPQGSLQLGGGSFGAILIAIGFGIVRYKKNNLLAPAIKELQATKAVLEKAKAERAYQEEAKRFPAKFYNYSDIYRLHQLVAEGRADSLKEAFNLLEQQKFQEKQISLQEEMNLIQSDIAASSRVTAAASVVNAVNTARVAANTSDIAANTAKTAANTNYR